MKPLYYAWHAGSLVFGSEIKALLRFPAMPHDIDLDAVALYLECQYIPAPYSVYAAIRKLPAGHWLSLKSGTLTSGEFWRPSYAPKHAFQGADAVDALSSQLTSSVQSMLVADVPLGCSSAAVSIPA